MSEHDEQAALFQWAALQSSAYPELELMLAIPNGGHRAKATAVKMKREGVKRGVPDIFLACPRNHYHGLFIELKTGDGKTSPEQLRWIASLNAYGYYARVVRGWETASQLILKYLRGEL